MTALDTNVIVRYVAQDDPVQSPIATKLIESLSTEEPGFIATVAVVELAWVLRRSYRSTRHEIARVLESLLRTRVFVVEGAELVEQALRLFSAGGADFSDCLLERSASTAGCDYTLTFDHVAATAPGMRLLK